MPTRREYLAAFATLIGTSIAGCANDVPESEARNMLDDVHRVGEMDDNDVHRGVDRDAGVVLYLTGTRIGDGHQGSLTAVPIENTNLE